MREKLLGAIMGLCVSDALGVPVEGESRDALAENPVTDMRGFGAHNQPAGTWSDDTSLTLCLLDSLSIKLDYDDMMRRFSRWLYGGEYTPYGAAFGAGDTTRAAIACYAHGGKARSCGRRSLRSNGNGSLMRILPLAFHLYARCGADIAGQDEPMRIVHNVSGLTHAHPCSLIACGTYTIIACLLLGGMALRDAIPAGLDRAFAYYERRGAFTDALESYDRLRDWDGFRALPAGDILSSGYVVHTLEAALYCLENTDDYRSCVLAAVNLGQDTDTVAAVAGGIAGLVYEYGAIPVEWIFQIPRRGWIEELCRTPAAHPPQQKGVFFGETEYARLEAEAAHSLERLTSLIVERDALLYRDCKDVEADYMLKLGALEYSLGQSEYAIRRLRRKIELLAAKDGSRPDPAALEAVLENEFSQQKERLTLLEGKLRSALHRGAAAPLNKEHSERLRSLYRFFAKRLHPELHPKGSAGDRLNYARALCAFEAGNIAALEALQSGFDRRDASELSPVRTPRELRRRSEGLDARCRRLETQIEALNASFPLSERDFLADDARVRSRQAELQTAVAICRRIQASLESQAGLLLKNP